MEQAHIAMLFARASGGDDWLRHQPFMASTSRATLLAEEARREFPPAGLTLYYQSIFTTGDHDLAGFEALLHLRHPRAGLLPPAVFLPALRGRERERRLCHWVLEQICRQLSQWREAGLEPPPVSVNLSDNQVLDPTLGSVIERLLARYRLRPGEIAIELDSQIFLHEPDRLFPRLLQLAALGLPILLDRYQPTSRPLPEGGLSLFDGVKLDRRLLSGPESDGRPVWLDPLRDAGLDLGAVGIENLAQLRRLRRLGCTRFQGFLLGRPLEAGSIPPLLTAPREENGNSDG